MVEVDCAAPEVFRPIRVIGGDVGWYFADKVWELRGLVDRATGGVGLRKGRRDPRSLAVGDAVDCWRVEAYEPVRLLRLFAEMRLPGRAWLQFDLNPHNGLTELWMTSIFEPRGLWGLIYWYMLLPIHRAVFVGMLRGIAKASKGGGPT
jgi:hypothetical protein